MRDLDEGAQSATYADDLASKTLDTRTPHVIAFVGIDANKTITFWLRWISTRGETGAVERGRQRDSAGVVIGHWPFVFGS